MNIEQLQGSTMLKNAPSIINGNFAEVETEVGKKVATTTYNEKMTEIDGSIESIEGDVTTLSSQKVDKSTYNTDMALKAPLTSPAFLTSATLDGNDIASVVEIDSVHIRFSNGLQILWGEDAVTTNSMSATGEEAAFRKYYSNLAYTFLYPFVSTPKVVVNTNKESYYWVASAMSITNTSMTLNVGGNSNGTQVKVNWLAIGFWK